MLKKFVLSAFALVVLGGVAAVPASAQYDHHHRHQVCTWHHHTKVCRWR